MSGARGDIGENDLHAAVDGRLSPERSAALDAYLAAHPEERANLQRDQDLREALRGAFMGSGDETLPTRLRIPRVLAERRRRRYQQFSAAAAALVIFVLGGLGGWAARDWRSGSLGTGENPQAVAEREITADALAAHRVYSVEVRHPVEVDASQEAHLVQWLSKRLGRPLVVPNLTAAGFQLVGGRLLPSEGGPAAQFMYQKGKDRLTLYERADASGETGFRYSEQNGVGVFYWSDQDFGYALAAKTDRQQLLQLAEVVYQQLSEGSKDKRLPAPAPGKPS